jgi:hypothetical protein
LLLLLLQESENDLKLASSMCQMENKHRLLKHNRRQMLSFTKATQMEWSLVSSQA